MKPLVEEWVAKAEADWRTANREHRVRKDPNHDAVCFHAQQSAEKYLKACLQDAGIRFARTHDLSVLLDAAVTVEPMWETMRPCLRLLTLSAVSVRYPGEQMDRETAKESIAVCRKVRVHARARLGLDSPTVRTPRRRRGKR